MKDSWQYVHTHEIHWTQWTWVWASSGSWWWAGRPGVLQPMGSQRVGHEQQQQGRDRTTTEWLNWTELIRISSSQRSWPNIAVIWPVEHSVITLYMIYDAFSSMGRMHGSGTKREELVVVSITVLPNYPRATFCFQSYNLGSTGLAVLVPKMGPLFPDMWQKFHWTGNWLPPGPLGYLCYWTNKQGRDYSSELAETVILNHQVKIRAATMWWGAQRELSCDLWILMIIMCKCWFISCEHCTSLVGSVDKAGSYASVWGGSKWEVSAPSSQLCCEPKTTLKFVFVKLMENYSDLIHRSFINRVLNQPDR